MNFVLALLAAFAPTTSASSTAPRAVGASQDPAPPRAEAPAPLEVVFLANEGFLIRAGDDVCLIDPFVTTPYSVYGALEGEHQRALLEHEAPFDAVDLVLTSHAHPDHFQRTPARAFLGRSDVLFVSSTQVMEALTSEEFPPRAHHIGVSPTVSEPAFVRHEGIAVTMYPLSHGTGRFADIQNMAHVIEIGGRTLVHLGDAAMDPANFAPLGLEKRELDVVFVPYWYFDSPAGRGIAERFFGDATLIACHVPPADRARFAKVMESAAPDVVVPDRPLEVHRIPPRVRGPEESDSSDPSDG